MSKLYKNKQGLCVLSGKVKNIAEDGNTLTIGYRQYDPITKTATDEQKTVIGLNGVAKNFRKGQNVTAVGFDMMQNFALVNNDPQYLTSQNSILEQEDLAVVSGHLLQARYNDEKRQDGTPNVKASGEPKKPHYDLKIAVDGKDGFTRIHFIKFYNYTTKDGKFVDNISNIAKKLESFDNGETTPTYITIVTSPGQNYEFEKDDGNIYRGSSHIGVKSIDIIREYSLNKTQEKSEVKEAETAAPQAAASAPVQNTPEIPLTTPETKETAVEEVEGIEMDEFDSAFE